MRARVHVCVCVCVFEHSYVIVPMTYRPQQQAFVLEISFDTILDWEHDNDSDEPLPQREASSSNSSEEAGESSGRRRMSVHGEVNLADRRWVLEEQQRFDIEDTGRPLQVRSRRHFALPIALSCCCCCFCHRGDTLASAQARA